MCLGRTQPFFSDVSRKFMRCVQIETLLVDNTASATCLEHSEILATPRIPVHARAPEADELFASASASVHV